MIVVGCGCVVCSGVMECGNGVVVMEWWLEWW